MKKIVILSMLSFAMICSCQKQDASAEQQLAQRKTELDARENALDERLNALNEKVNVLDARVKALTEKKKATLNAVTTPSDVQSEIPDPAQAQTERERAIQQFSAQMRSTISNDSKRKAGKDTMQQDPRAQRQNAPGGLQSQGQPKLKMSSGAVFPAPAATSQTPSSALEATSPTPSTAPQQL